MEGRELVAKSNEFPLYATDVEDKPITVSAIAADLRALPGGTTVDTPTIISRAAPGHPESDTAPYSPLSEHST